MELATLAIIWLLSIVNLEAFRIPLSRGVAKRGPGAHSLVINAAASANELSRSGNGKDNERIYDFGTAKEELDEDALFEREMAQEMFDMLRGEDEALSIDAFLEWDDIKDVIELGIIDPETMALIIEAVQGKNPVRDILTFEQWLEAVELVNQVQLTLESVEEETDSWNPVAEQEAMDAAHTDDSIDTTQESVMQMLQAFGLKPNVEVKGKDDGNARKSQ